MLTFQETHRDNDISNSGMGLFIIAIFADNLFQFGSNYLALFLFIIDTSNLSIFDKVSCECEWIAADNTQLTNKIKKLSNNICALSAEININSQVNLKCFVVAKPTLHWTIWFAWTQVLLALSMLFCRVWILKHPSSFFHQMLRRRRVMTSIQKKMMLNTMTPIFKSDGYEIAEDQDVSDWKDLEPDEFLTFYVGNH